MIYRGEKTRVISFPLGGIGSGSIGLAGNGSLVDWEIFNKPNKNSNGGYSHFAIKAEGAGKVVDARILIGDLQPPYIGGGAYAGFGFGPARQTMQGFPHFSETTFDGEFPLATVSFKDKTFPARITQTAFNPFIPLNDKDSSIPATFFEFEIKNTTTQTMKYTLSGCSRIATECSRFIVLKNRETSVC